MEYHVCRLDSEVRTIVDRAELIADAHGQPLHIIGTVQNITERKRLEDQLCTRPGMIS